MFQAVVHCDGEHAMDSIPCQTQDGADFLGQLGKAWVQSYGVDEERISYEVTKCPRG